MSVEEKNRCCCCGGFLSSCIQNAFARRHLVYLIVECLTHHHTWISLSFARFFLSIYLYWFFLVLFLDFAWLKKQKHNIYYLPCNLMEIFAIFFPFFVKISFLLFVDLTCVCLSLESVLSLKQ